MTAPNLHGRRSRCPLGTCDRCNALYAAEQDARCPNRPASLVRRVFDNDPVVAFGARLECLFWLVGGVLLGLVVVGWFQ